MKAEDPVPEDDENIFFERNSSRRSGGKRKVERLSLDSGIGLGNDSYNDSHTFNSSADFDTLEAESSSISVAPSAAEVSQLSNISDVEHDISIQSSSSVSILSPKNKVSRLNGNSSGFGWWRVTTPPSKLKESKPFNNYNQHPSFFSPPTIRPRSHSTLLKTPDPLRGMVKISSPSRIRVVLTSTPLKLSNEENVAQYHIGRPDDIKRINSRGYIRLRGIKNPTKRCLVASDDIEGMPGIGINESPNRISFEPFHFLDDSPTKINNSLENDDPAHVEYSDDSEFTTSRHCEEPSTSKQADALNDGEFLNLLQPRGLNNYEIIKNEVIVRDTEDSFAIISNEPLKENIPKGSIQNSFTKKSIPVVLPIAEKEKRIEFMRMVSQKEKRPSLEELMKEELENNILKWKEKPFVSPKKELAMFTGRWIVISTGRTLAQRELLSDARSFFARKYPSLGRKIHLAARKYPYRNYIPALSRINLFKHRFTKNESCDKNILKEV